MSRGDYRKDLRCYMDENDKLDFETVCTILDSIENEVNDVLGEIQKIQGLTEIYEIHSKLENISQKLY